MLRPTSDRLAKAGPELTKFGLTSTTTSANFGEIWPGIGQLSSKLTDFGPTSAEFGQPTTEFGRPKMAERYFLRNAFVSNVA